MSRRNYLRKRARKRYRLGICLRCPKRRARGRTACEKCLELDREKRNERTRNGLCRDCGIAPILNRVHCDSCLKKIRGHYQKNKEKFKKYARKSRNKNKKHIIAKQKERYEKNKDEILSRNKKYRDKNEKKLLEQKRFYRLRKMGLSKQEITKAQQALRDHDGVCKICKVKKPGGMGGWLIDHNHKTKKFRGILCNRCNTLIGFAEDQVDILFSAIQYLQTL